MDRLVACRREDRQFDGSSGLPGIRADLEPQACAPADKTSLEIADTQYNAALEHSDISVLREMIVDTYVFTDPTGRVSNKKQVIEGLETGRIRIRSQTTKDVRIIVFDNTAIETGLLTSVAMRDGRNSGGTFVSRAPG